MRGTGIVLLTTWLWPLGLCGCAADRQVSDRCGAGESARGDGDGCCAPGEMPLEGGGCQKAGAQKNGCVAGEVLSDNGECRPAGIPPEMCGEGFEPDGRLGCSPILPDPPCEKGKMAIPGDLNCHDLADCGAGPWGNVPVDRPGTQFVNGAYLGTSDGSQERPWTTVQAGIDAVDPLEKGAIVAVAAGSYPENVFIIDKSVQVWGRCPELTEVAGIDTEAPIDAAFAVGPGSDETEVHSLAIRGPDIGFTTSGSKDIRLEAVWVHDTGRTGILVESTALGETVVNIHRSLVEDVHFTGVHALGGEAHIEETVVRRTVPMKEHPGVGIGISAEINEGDPLGATLTIKRSFVEDAVGAGVRLLGSNGEIESTLIQDTREGDTLEVGNGEGLLMGSTGARRSDARISKSVVRRNQTSAVGVYGSDAKISATVLREVRSGSIPDYLGAGIVAQALPWAAGRSTLNVDSSLIDETRTAAILIAGSTGCIEGTLIRNSRAQALPKDGGDGAFGYGMQITDDDSIEGHKEPGKANVRATTVLDSARAGVFIGSRHVYLDGVRVGHSAGSPPPVGNSVGILIRPPLPENAEAGGPEVRASILEHNRGAGILLLSVDALIQGTVVRDTEPALGQQGIGAGVFLMESPSGGTGSSRIVASVLSHNHGVGAFALFGTLTLEKTLVDEVERSPEYYPNSIGVAGVRGTGPTRLVLSQTHISGNDVGLLLQGADLSIERTSLQCNDVNMGVVTSGDTTPILSNLGENECFSGCFEPSSCQPAQLDVQVPTYDFSDLDAPAP